MMASKPQKKKKRERSHIAYQRGQRHKQLYDGEQITKKPQKNNKKTRTILTN
jgi:hypothetical protein